MPSVERLQTKLDSLQDEYDLLSKKLRSLRRSRAIETDAAVKTKLDVQIEETAEELDQVEQELDQIEQQLHGLSKSNGSNLEEGVSLEQLHGALLKLGYWEQQRSFKKITKDHAVGAFLIHGCSSEYGQRWLLNRLVLEISRSMEGKIVKVNLGRIVSRNDIPALWRELAGRTGLGRQSALSEIVERVHQWWQTQNVIIILYDVHYTIEENLCDLLNDFWKVLAQRVAESHQKSHYKLLMFLLDHQGCVGSWNVNLAKQYDSTWHPVVPIGLPEINPFSAELLINWIEHQSDDLPEQLTDEVEGVVQSILENTENGVPEPTLREICDLCGYNWYDQEDKWLKL